MGEKYFLATLILTWYSLITTIKSVQSDGCSSSDHGNLYTTYSYRRMLNINPAENTCSRQSFKTLQNWQLSNRLHLLLPIETEKRNFVRQVNNVIFSLCVPTPFSHPPKLVAASKDVIEYHLDLKYEHVIQSKHFVDLVAGHILQNGSMPISHRYGGHQVYTIEHIYF